MISLLLTLLIAVLILAIIWYAMGAVGLPDPPKTIVMLVALLIVILYLIRGYAV